VSTFMDDVFIQVIGALTAGLIGVLTASAQGYFSTRAQRKYYSRLVKYELERISSSLQSFKQLYSEPIPNGPPTHLMEVHVAFDLTLLKSAKPFINYLPDADLKYLDSLLYDLRLLDSMMNLAHQASIIGNNEYRNVKLAQWWSMVGSNADDHIHNIQRIVGRLKV
jgi:hypothetical protein